MTNKTTITSELLAELTRRGFIMNEHNCLVYERDSISNYISIKIYQPRPYCSLAANEEYVPTYYIQYESFSEPGYLECDWKWKRIEEGYVAEANLLRYLDEKHIG